ncbi:hypothetical protein [Palleronia rufa]|uniref:hypothetical protein n=1 Tax=Palleronia rufa TaxID=1530186 RepID=UPI000689FAD6|nr:hypothetical protein [Palleronia rufa]
MPRRLNTILRATYLRARSAVQALGPLPAAQTRVDAADAESPASYGGPLRIRDAAWAEAEATAPDAPPHYGAALDRLVRAAALNPRPPTVGAEYDRIKPHFDAAFYFAHQSDIAAKRIDPVAHYIQAGAREGRDPTSLFSTRSYLRRYPDVADHPGTPFDHWLTRGRAEGRDAAPASLAGMNEVLGLTDAQIVDRLAARHADLRDRLATGELGRMVTLAARHDPAVLRVWPAALRLRVLPFSTTRITDRIACLYRMQAALGWRRARAVIVTGGDGGPEPVVERTLAAAVAAFGAADVVVLQTASLPPAPLPFVPPGLRVLHIPDQARRHRDDNTRLLADLLRSLRPAAVIADHAPLFSAALQSYGRALRAGFNIAMIAPCDQPTPLGHLIPAREGMLYRILPMIDLLICEDPIVRNRLADAHHLDAADRGRLVPIADLEAPGAFEAAIAAPRRGDMA